MDGVWNPHTPPLDFPLQSAYHSDGYSDPSAEDTLDNKSHFPLQDPEEWQVDDVLLWLAATNNYLYAEVFRECEITGAKLREMTDVKLAQMNISDSTHKQSLLLAIQELFTGLSETVSRAFNCDMFSLAPSTNNACDANIIWDTQPEAVVVGSSWSRDSSSLPAGGRMRKEGYKAPKRRSTLLGRETDLK